MINVLENPKAKWFRDAISCSSILSALQIDFITNVYPHYSLSFELRPNLKSFLLDLFTLNIYLLFIYLNVENPKCYL